MLGDGDDLTWEGDTQTGPLLAFKKKKKKLNSVLLTSHPTTAMRGGVSLHPSELRETLECNWGLGDEWLHCGEYQGVSFLRLSLLDDVSLHCVGSEFPAPVITKWKITDILELH